MESGVATESDVWHISDDVVGSHQGKKFERILECTLWSFGGPCSSAPRREFLDGPSGFSGHPNMRVRGFLWPQRSPLYDIFASRVVGSSELEIPNNNMTEEHDSVIHDHPSCRKLPKRYTTPVRFIDR